MRAVDQDLRRWGGTLVSARVPDAVVAEAEAVLERHRSVDAAMRGTTYREGGWQSFDEQARPIRSTR